MAPLRGLFPPGKIPSISYSWVEFLEGNGIITFYGALFPGKTIEYEYFKGPRDTMESITLDTEWYAQTFTIGTIGTDEDFYPTKILLDSDSTGASIRVEIQETTTGEPNGTVLAAFLGGTNVRISDTGATPEWWEYDISDSNNPNLKLRAGTVYALVIYRDLGNNAKFGFDSSGGYAGGSKYDSADSGVNWTIDTGADILFVIKGSTKNPFILTAKSVTSSKASSSMIVTASVKQFTEVNSIDFEGKINTSAIIDGDAIVNASISSVNMDKVYAIVELYHVRGASETKIGEGEGWTSGATVEMELTKTKVSRGDTIKLKFRLFYMKDPIVVDTSAIGINHSGSDLTLQLPFKIDL